MPPKQTMKGIKSGAKVIQRSDIDTNQIMEDVDAAGDVSQLIEVAANNLPEIVKELEVLKTKVLERDPTARIEGEKLTGAIVAGKAKDAPAMLNNLKDVARWVGILAKDVGVAVAAKLIEKSAGIS